MMLLKFILLIAFSVNVNLTDGLTINNTKTNVEMSLIDFINEGEQIITKTALGMSEDVIMVLGATGTGKSTLVNYLNGIPLICKNERGKWFIQLQDEKVTLPGGFSIGNSVSSETIYPAVYTNDSLGYSFVDNPGFADTRGLAIEIANGYFRKLITTKSSNLKLLLLLVESDLKDKGHQFRDSIKTMSSIIGLFDKQDLKEMKKLQNSIGMLKLGNAFTEPLID